MHCAVRISTGELHFVCDCLVMVSRGFVVHFPLSSLEAVCFCSSGSLAIKADSWDGSYLVDRVYDRLLCMGLEPPNGHGNRMWVADAGVMI